MEHEGGPLAGPLQYHGDKKEESSQGIVQTPLDGDFWLHCFDIYTAYHLGPCMIICKLNSTHWPMALPFVHM